MRSLVLAFALGTFAAPASAQMTAGTVLIKLEAPAKTDAEAEFQLKAFASAEELGLRLERRSVLGWIVATIDAKDEGETDAALAKVRGEKGVVAVDRVRMRYAQRLPDDEFVGELWSFAGIAADLAWETTVGLPTQRIGVVDTGMNRDHIDLIAKDQRGFDFISSASLAEDGNGRDADYSDVPGADFHGSHVAGTIAASANDGIGVPGLNWNAQLVTGRAIGPSGGSTLDIMEAAAWMAGFAVDGVPSVGADRVSVINMSLGADEPCSAFEAEVTGAIIAAGVAIVAAAGNTSNFTPTGSPASCPGVIAVGAAGPSFELASYSNFDSRTDVVAPGGDGFEFDPATSILSVDGSGDFGYVAYDGTSMASPHVAGVVSLMQAVNPRLSPRQIRDILAQSPFTCGGFTCDDKPFLDAPSAVELAANVDGELDDAPAPPAGGGPGCPANSRPSPDGDGCVCNAGFAPNAALTACVADGGGSGNGVCPANSTISDDGQTCFCDPGFVVNAAGDGCEPKGGRDPDEDADEDDDDGDDDRRSRRSVGGCSSAGPSASIGGLLALLALARRRARRPGAGLAPVAVLALVGSLGGTGCAHAVRIESTPGAEIYVDGKHVGASPVIYQETTGSRDTVQVTAKLNGREKTVAVQRSDVDVAPIGAGAGIGAATCGTGLAVTVVSAFVFLPCALVTGAASWGALAAAPAVSWWFFSYKMPDVVKVDLGEPPRVATAAEGVEASAAGF